MKTKDLKKYICPFNLVNFQKINTSAIGHGAFFTTEMVLYNRVAKSANSSTLLYLFQFLRHQVLSNDEAKQSVTRAWDLGFKESSLFDRYYKFTIVRNPYHRLLSAFLDKVASGNIKKFSYIPGYKSSEHSGFEDFVTWLDRDNHTEFNHHWAPQESLLLITPEKFNRIGKVENYSKDMSSIFDDLGILYDNKALFEKIFPTITKPDYRSAELAKNYYSEKSLKTVYRLYEKDFDLFKYPSSL